MSSKVQQNMFACLDSDDEEAPKVVAPKVVAPAPTAAAPAVGKAAGNKAGPAAAADKKAFKKPTIVEPSKVEGEKRPERGERRRKEGEAPRAPRPPRTSGDAAPSGGESKVEGDSAAPRAPKREFERRSGTGRDRSIKKQGGGGRNWGSNESEVAVETVEATSEAVAVSAEPETLDETAAAAVEEAPKEKEPEDNTLTLDQYLAKKATETRTGEAFAALSLRTVDAPSDAQVVARGEEEVFIQMGKTSEKAKKENKTKKEKVVLGGESVGFRSAPIERGGDDDRRPGGRGGAGRGAGRGGPGRGGGRGDRPEGARGGGRGGVRGSGRAPNVADSKEYPTLG